MPTQQKKKKLKPKKLNRVAVVDIGSNSVRLVIYYRNGRQYEIAKDQKSICRLALGLDHKRPRLNRRGVLLTLRALKKFKVVIHKNKVSQVFAIGTAAMRAVAHTSNGQTFHRKAERALGHKIDIITGRKEARLTAHGVLSFLPRASGVCGDLGGGSLELAAIGDGHISHTATVSLGTLTLLSETHGDPLVAENLVNQRIRKVLWLQQAQGKTFYAIGGSWRAVGRLMMKRSGVAAQPVHGFTINAKQALQHASAIAQQKPSDFLTMSSKINQRADIIPMAAAAMVELITHMQPRRIIFSGRGVREGLVRQSRA